MINGVYGRGEGGRKREKLWEDIEEPKSSNGYDPSGENCSRCMWKSSWDYA